MPLKQLVRLLTLFALLLAPLGMLGGASAMAAAPSADASAGSGHCAEMAATHDQAPDKRTPAKSLECLMDCMVLCSGMPSVSVQLVEQMPPEPMAMLAARSAPVRGLTPQAEPRPPQFS